MEKNHKIKLTALLLLISISIISIILCALIVSCGGDNKADDANNNNDQNQNPANGGEPGDTVTANPLDELYPYPEHDFNGETIHILARKDDWAGGSQDFEDLKVEAETGEVFNDAVYYRTRKVEEKYNMQLNVTYVADPNATISKLIKAGDDEYQIIQEKLMFMSSSLVPYNYLLDLKTVSSINLDAPWYNQNAIRDLSINNKINTLGGDMTISDKSGIMMNVFNKKLAEQYAIENLYNTVREGKWTLDKMYELIIQTTVDLNGDGKLTFKDDQWGLVSEDYMGWDLAIASGNRLGELDENGIPYITCTTEKYVSDYEKIKKVMYEKDGRVETADDVEHVRIFYENRAFISNDVMAQIAMLRGMEEDFGIIPLPKQDENQKDYIASISAWTSRFIAVPSTCNNPETVGAVIDAMSRESTNTISPAYFDNLLYQKIARDEDSIEMLQNIFASAIYDIAAVYNWGGIWDEQQRFIYGKKEDYIGNYERIEGKVLKDMEKTIETMHQFD